MVATGKADVDASSAGASADQQTSFTEHGDKARAAHGFESRTVDSDIGQSEAWSANMKKMYDDFAHLQERVHVNDLRSSDNVQRIFEQDWAARLVDERVANKSYAVASQAGWNNLVDEEKRVMAQETRHVDLAVDRQWNLDEQAQLVVASLREIFSSRNLETDALVAAIKAVFDGVSTK